MFFDNTTDPKARDAIARAHKERGKIFGELIRWALSKH
jgi:hypothetical protein